MPTAYTDENNLDLAVVTGDPHKKTRIAYLLSRYPAVSHTFFLKEISGLRKLGLEIETASINHPDRPLDRLPAEEASEAGKTYYVKAVRKSALLGNILLSICYNPLVVVRGLIVAWSLSSWDSYRRLYAILYLLEALILGRWMKQRKIDHLHIHFGGPVATVGMLTAKAWGFTYSLTIHGPEEFYDVEQSYLPRKIELASFILCISYFCQSQLMKYCSPTHWDKLHVVHLGVDIDQFRPIQLIRPTAPLHLVCVGRLVPAKGQYILLEAFHSLLTQGHSLRLTLIGDGPDRAVLEAFTRERHLEDSITFCGALNHDQTREHLAQADIFVLASFAEGVPVALMEAMAMEIPCVSTCIAGIPELIRDRVDGLLVPASSVDSLARAIGELVADPSLRRRLGVSARAQVAEHFNLAHNLKLLRSTFETCLERHTL